MHVELEQQTAALQRHLRGRQVESGRRVVHEDVDGPQHGLRVRHDPCPVVGVGEVGPDRERTASTALDRGDRLVQRSLERAGRVERACGDRDGRSLGGQAPGDGCADAAAGAGDERGASLETHGPGQTISGPSPSAWGFRPSRSAVCASRWRVVLWTGSVSNSGMTHRANRSSTRSNAASDSVYDPM